jgi:hypothetical protein
VTPPARRPNPERGLGPFRGEPPVVFVEPQAKGVGLGVACQAVARLAEKVDARVGVPLGLRFVYQVVGGLPRVAGVGEVRLPDIGQFVGPGGAISDSRLSAREAYEPSRQRIPFAVYMSENSAGSCTIPVYPFCPALCIRPKIPECGAFACNVLYQSQSLPYMIQHSQGLCCLKLTLGALLGKIQG